MREGRWRLWTVALAVIAALALLAGCGGDDDPDATTGADETTGETADPAAGEGKIVGLVSDVGKFNDRSFNQSALEGLTRAEEDFGVDGQEIESAAAGDYIPNLTSLADGKNAEVTIAVGFLMAEDLGNIATQFPDKNFAIVDFPQVALEGTPANVRGLNFATNENSYLIGYMAAKMADAAGGDTISAVGGEEIPPVTIFIEGYKLGAEAAVPGINVQVDYSQDFVDQAKCKELALTQIDQGSQVVFQVAGGCGLGALDAAREKEVWGIGVDRDQSDLGDHILTSAVKRVDTAVYSTAESVVNGDFAGGDVTFNLANEGVEVGTTSSEVPQDLLDEIDDLRQQIIDGSLDTATPAS